MAGSLQAVPGFDLQPSAERVTLSTNYITNFDFLNQYLPDTYEREFARYGNRSVASFLRMVSAELPSTSDLIKWSEQGRLHIKYTGVTTDGALGDGDATLTIPAGQLSAKGFTNGQIAIRVGQTVVLSEETGGSGINRGIVTSVNYTARTFNVAYYESTGQAFAVSDTVTVFIYGSEFKKGTNGMQESLEADSQIFENNPIIIKDKYAVNGSDMAQIGWIEIEGENGTGFLWYMKSQHETRKRFEDYLETAMIEAVPAQGSVAGGAAALGFKGTKGFFHEVKTRGNLWDGGNPTTLGDFDTVVQRLDKQGAIEENAIFLERQFGFDIDDMLAAQNSYGAGGTSYGLFNNSSEMALNLGFTGFRRGYDFYKTDWKYLNDPTMRGGIPAGKINGALVPAGTTSVYDEVMGESVKRPFLHVRYRQSATENRKYKTWITGSAGGASNSDLDAMEAHFLSERALCVLGANNFFLFED
jgi:hypothetical protein